MEEEEEVGEEGEVEVLEEGGFVEAVLMFDEKPLGLNRTEIVDIELG